jgi:hypothetical protein
MRKLGIARQRANARRRRGGVMASARCVGENGYQAARYQWRAAS